MSKIPGNFFLVSVISWDCSLINLNVMRRKVLKHFLKNIFFFIKIKYWQSLIKCLKFSKIVCISTIVLIKLFKKIGNLNFYKIQFAFKYLHISKFSISISSFITSFLNWILNLLKVTRSPFLSPNIELKCTYCLWSQYLPSYRFPSCNSIILLTKKTLLLLSSSSKTKYSNSIYILQTHMYGSMRSHNNNHNNTMHVKFFYYYLFSFNNNLKRQQCYLFCCCEMDGIELTCLTKEFFSNNRKWNGEKILLLITLAICETQFSSLGVCFPSYCT